MENYINREQLTGRIKELHGKLTESIIFAQSLSVDGSESARGLEKEALLGNYRELGELRGLCRLYDDYFGRNELAGLRDEALNLNFKVLESLLFNK